MMVATAETRLATFKIGLETDVSLPTMFAILNSCPVKVILLRFAMVARI